MAMGVSSGGRNRAASWPLRVAIAVALVLYAVLVQGTAPAKAATTVGTNVNVSRIAGNQDEPAIAVDPADPKLAFVSSNNDGGGLLLASSSDAGATWSSRVGANGSDSLPRACCDSSLSWDEFGNLFLVYLDANTSAGTVHVLLSIDGGKTFSTLKNLDSGGVDQPTVTTGAHSVWVTWTDASDRISSAGAAVTGLGASHVGSFTAIQHAGNGDFGDIAIGPTGAVLVTYQRPHNGTAPSTLFAALDPDGLGSAGFNPEVTVTSVNMSGFTSIPPQSGRPVDAEAGLAWDRSGGPHNGRVYFIYTDAPSVGSTDTNIFSRFSDDNGSTWSSPLRINDDTGTRSQFLPRIALDQGTGKLAASWLDARNSSDGKSAQLFAATSDDGTAWSANLQVSTGTSNAAAAASQVDYGDYLGLVYVSGSFYPVWSDNSNSTGDNPDGANHAFDIYTAVVVVSPPPPPPPTTTTIASSANPSVFGQPVTFTVTVSSPAGTPTGSVTVTADGIPLGSPTLSGGQAFVTTSTLAVGSHTIVASYPGDGTFQPSSASIVQVVNRAPTTTVLTSSQNPSDFGQPVTFTATVTVNPPGAGTPTGTVTFRRGAITLGTAPVSGGGQAVLTANGLQVGASVITAAYGGDGNFLPSTSGPLTQTVRCRTNLTGRINGGLEVGPGSTCLNGATVHGAVKVEPGGALSVTNSTLHGGVHADGALALTVCASTVHGAIHADRTMGFVLLGDAGDDGAPVCSGNSFDGSVSLDGTLGQFEVGGNTIHGSLRLSNTSGVGPDQETLAPETEANVIKGSLDCTGNVPAPTNDGLPNSVTGASTGQCAGL